MVDILGGRHPSGSLDDRTSSPEPALPLLVCFSHLRWDFVWQRPQHLLVRAARSFRVIVIEEPIHRGNEPVHLDVTPRDGGIWVAVPVLPEGTSHAAGIAAQRAMIAAMIEAEPAERRLFWYYTPMALALSDRLEADLCVYDNMDELSAFRGASPEMLAFEAALFDRADIVFTGGISLYEAKRGRHPNIHAFPSSIDAAHFATAREPAREEPEDQAAIPHPRLGFFGVIDERMDVDLVDAVASLRPDWQLVMIGPVVKIDPATLPRRPNVHWLGPRHYGKLPAYLGGWDVGLMPFALNESTRFISPTKTPEYLAAGVPVVSTPIVDVMRTYGESGLVAIADGAEAVVAAAEALLARDRTEWLATTDRHLATVSWDRTWAAMLGLIREAEGARLAQPALAAAE